MSYRRVEGKKPNEYQYQIFEPKVALIPKNFNYQQ